MQVLLRTKLDRPTLQTSAQPRARLEQALFQGICRPVIVVSAPAGSGKTTLLSHWVAHCGMPVAWLSLGRADSEPITFGSYFVAAIRTVHANAAQDTANLLAGQVMPPECIAEVLVNDLAQLTQPLVLVLDDYHVIHDRDTHKILSALIEHMPPHVHVVISSRVDPPIGIARLRAQGKLAEIRAADLRFSAEESRTYLEGRSQVALPKSLINIISARTEGWIAGLQLASISLQQSTDLDQFARHFQHHSNRHIVDFLFEDVLSHQPKAIQNFMLCLSVLERFSLPLCDALIAEDLAFAEFDTRQALRWLERANLFLVSLDESRQWFRFHHLFRDMLLRHLEEARGKVEAAQLHRRAAAWFAEQGLIEEALHHALAINDMDSAAALVEQHHMDLLNREDWHTLRRRLDMLPDSAVLSRPRLLLAKARLDRLQGGLGDQTELIDMAQTLVDRANMGDAERDIMQGYIDSMRSGIALHMGDAASAAAYAEHVLTSVPHSWSFVRGHAWLEYAVAKSMLGESAAASDALLRALAGSASDIPVYRLHLMNALTVIIRYDGDVIEKSEHAEHWLAQALACAHPLSIGWAHLSCGSAYYERNELTEAARHFNANVEMGYSVHRRSLHESTIGLALTALARGEPDKARAIAKTLYQSHLETSGEVAPAFLIEARSFIARLALAAGDVDAALSWAHSAGSDMQFNPMTYTEVPLLTKAKVLIASPDDTDRQAAGALLENLLSYSRAKHLIFGQIEVLALRALLLQSQRLGDAALDSLCEALTLAAPRHYARTLIDLGLGIATLLRQVIAQGHHTAYANHLIGMFGSSDTVDGVTRPHASPNGKPATPLLPEPLTYREIEILGLLSHRLSNKEISEKLHITVGTVGQHTNRIFRKLDVSCRKDAVQRAAEIGLI